MEEELDKKPSHTHKISLSGLRSIKINPELITALKNERLARNKNNVYGAEVHTDNYISIKQEDDEYNVEVNTNETQK